MELSVQVLCPVVPASDGPEPSNIYISSIKPHKLSDKVPLSAAIGYGCKNLLITGLMKRS